MAKLLQCLLNSVLGHLTACCPLAAGCSQLSENIHHNHTWLGSLDAIPLLDLWSRSCGFKSHPLCCRLRPSASSSSTPASVIKDNKLVLAKRRECFEARKITIAYVYVFLHTWPCVTDFVVYPPMGDNHPACCTTTTGRVRQPEAGGSLAAVFGTYIWGRLRYSAVQQVSGRPSFQYAKYPAHCFSSP